MTSEETGFKCDECGKEFNDSINLNRHIKQAHKDKFKCSICGKGFSSKLGLAGHLQKHEAKKRKAITVSQIEDLINNYNGEPASHWAHTFKVTTSQINKVFNLIKNVEKTDDIMPPLLPRTIEEKVALVLSRKGLKIKS